ncbi:hypothetical protein [Calothrix sp. UHCC 0171]|uniref:hypothetical protein n=1 Tax=Calothrix sp. UHCC 0171 TaxID=3110245 RepID=UPI002B1F33B1|nr:hypothetical protein [Calothrix sp. UHCC 0171]MEA5573112.1 hypothetical protein [Calothrix sp. UHCC 0171]
MASQLINLVNAIRPLSLCTNNIDNFIKRSAYEIGYDLGKRLGEEEYLPTLQDAITLYHSGLISKLSTDMKTLVYVCTNTLQNITPGIEFSVQSFEIHLRSSARLAAYYAVVQLYLRASGITPEKIIAKLGQEFYDSLMTTVGITLSFKYVQKNIQSLNIFEWIEDTAQKVESKINSSTFRNEFIVNRIFDIAKYKQNEIKAALAIAVKWEKELKNIAALQYSIDNINAAIEKAEKDYDLVKAAELKYTQLTKLEKELLKLEDDVKLKVIEYMTELKFDNSDELTAFNCMSKRSKEEKGKKSNQLESTRINQPETIVNPAVVEIRNPVQAEKIDSDHIFTSLQYYISGLCDISLEDIKLESTVFLGDYANIKASNSGIWSGSYSNDNMEIYDALKNSFNMDVLDGVELLNFIEQEFDIDIPLEHYGKVFKLEEVVNIIIQVLAI